MRGKFITFEGDDGTGKSTQARRLQTALRAVGVAAVLTREPGGSGGGEMIRNLLLEHGPWSAATQVHLFSAARQDHVENLIEPHLAAGYWVVCDRYYDSMVAYQRANGYTGIFQAPPLWPDLTILLTADPAVAKRRRQEQSDFLAEDEARHDAVRAHYTAESLNGSGRWLTIDGNRGPLEVHQDIWKALLTRWPEELRHD
ncbi:Tmk Thymidylate kinase [uncultured Caudovirales phage]|uniref:dTMP kinase n=1 Tax=uncultured Caudovirales phage TaxID=2100421 RepID=A0A6J5NTM9_9CAUD|nr:Tmk Thymidylate kinase [uncultured Caudovirales phage]